LTEHSETRAPETAARGTRRRDPEGRRRAIITATIAVIASSGLGAVTHRKVAQQAGVPLGSTTYYFSCIDDLVTAALTEATQAALHDLEHWREVLSATDDLAGALTSYTVEYFDRLEGNRSVTELYTAASHNPELQPLARTWSEGFMAVFAERMDLATAAMISTFIDGALLGIAINDQAPDEAVLRAAFQALLDSQR
jgi:DNA-binding transcriptional regulator YbjK